MALCNHVDDDDDKKVGRHPHHPSVRRRFVCCHACLPSSNPLSLWMGRGAASWSSAHILTKSFDDEANNNHWYRVYVVLGRGWCLFVCLLGLFRSKILQTCRRSDHVRSESLKIHSIIEKRKDNIDPWDHQQFCGRFLGRRERERESDIITQAIWLTGRPLGPYLFVWQFARPVKGVDLPND